MKDFKFETLAIIQAASPYRTGKLRASFGTIDYDDGFGIFTDIEYMKYTEERWGFHSRWGKTLINPNEGWFNEAALLVAENIAYQLGGKVYVIK